MKTKHLILIALAFVTASCMKTKNYYVNDASRVWFVDNTNCRFTMQDDNSVSYSFQLERMGQNMLENGMSILGVPVEKSLHEDLHQNGTCSYSSALRFYLGITAYKLDDEHEGTDQFMLYVGESLYTMRIDGDQFYPVGCYDMAYQVGKMGFESEYLDNYFVHDKEYQGVMHLKLVDIAYPQSQFFPTEIYYAMHYGLIQVTLDDRLTLYRLPE